MARGFCAAAIALAAGTMALPGYALAKPAKDQVLTADSQTAMIVIKSDFWQPAHDMHSAYKIAFSTYDPVEGKMLGGVFAGGALVEAQKKKFVEGYLIQPIKPGHWVYVSYQQQDKWALCFNAASLQFDVKPGEVVYLGELDAQSHRKELTLQALLHGKTSIRGYGFADFFDLPDGPRVKPVDEPQLVEVRAMLARNAPLITAPVRAAVYSPAQFGTGSTLFAERKCGGYFATGVKKKA
jgi:hypothetical protein